MADFTVREAFLSFHRSNPHVYREILRYAREMKARGRTRYSIWTIVGRVRWDHDIATDGRDEFKINNNFSSIYARMVEHFHPDLRGFFETRQMAGEHWLDAEFFRRTTIRSDYDDPTTGQLGLGFDVRRTGPDQTTPWGGR